MSTSTVALSTVIDRMNAGNPDAVRVPVTSARPLDGPDPLAEVGRHRKDEPATPGPATVLGVFDRMLQRTRWALYRNGGRAAYHWSLGERLFVALVLGDREALDDLGWSEADAEAAVSAVLALKAGELDGWIGELRAVL
jgi:hypothetical protein